MITLTYDCPHCDAQRVGFTYVAEARTPHRLGHGWQVFLQCNACFGPLIATVYTDISGAKPSNYRGNLESLSNFSFDGCIPERKPSIAPGHIPAAISSAFIQAEEALRRRHWEAAGAMDRRALEIATKEMAPEHARLNLYPRIEKLAEAGKLTESLKDWAHNLRAVGNEAVHEMDGIDEQEATQAHELTRFILTYLYTLPKQVELARAARENGG